MSELHVSSQHLLFVVIKGTCFPGSYTAVRRLSEDRREVGVGNISTGFSESAAPYQRSLQESFFRKLEKIFPLSLTPGQQSNTSHSLRSVRESLSRPEACSRGDFKCLSERALERDLDTEEKKLKIDGIEPLRARNNYHRVPMLEGGEASPQSQP